jgi:alpha-D-xyloside xylohydrolase
MGPMQQYADEKPNAPLEIRIYPRANGDFTIYEGDNCNYEHGKSARIRLRWDDKTKSLIIAERKGNFVNMIQKREFRIVLVQKGQGVGLRKI